MLLATVVAGTLAGPRVRGLLAHSGWLTAGALAICVPLGVLAAVAIEKTNAPGRRLLWWGLIGWMFVPLCVQTAAWQTVLGPGGWLTGWGDAAGGGAWLAGWRGAVWVHGMAGVAWVAVAPAAALRTVDPAQEEAALQDNKPLGVLRRISLPQTAPGVLAGALWVAATCVTEISATDFFQVRTFAEEVYTQAALGAIDAPAPGATGLTGGDLGGGVAVLAGLFAGGGLLAAGWLAPLLAEVRSQISWGGAWRWDDPRAKLLGGAVCLAVLVPVVATPAVSLFAKAGVEVEQTDDGYYRGWSAAKAAGLVAASPYRHRREVFWSLVIAGGASTLAVGLAVPLAWAVRTGRLPVGVLLVLGAAALATPSPVLAVWLIKLLNQPPDSPLAALSWWYDHTVLAPVVVQAVRAGPLALLLVGLPLSTVPADIISAARSDGAGWWSTLLRIAVPMRLPALAAAWLLALVHAGADAGATLLVAPPGAATLTMRTFSLLHYGAQDDVAALCLALLLGVAASAAIAAACLRVGRLRADTQRLR
ncbi:MAG: ABC transporter permease subunit [Planctomycetota bacterium]